MLVLLNFLLFLVIHILLNMVISNNVLFFWLLLLLHWFFLLSGFMLSYFLFFSFFFFLLRLFFCFFLCFSFVFFFFLPFFLLHFFFQCGFFSLLLFCGLSLSLSFCLGLHRFLLCHLGCNLFIVLIIPFGTATKNLLNVKCGIDTWSGGSEHLLEEKIRFLWFMTRNYLSRFNIDLFSHH